MKLRILHVMAAALATAALVLTSVPGYRAEAQAAAACMPLPVTVHLVDGYGRGIAGATVSIYHPHGPCTGQHAEGTTDATGSVTIAAPLPAYRPGGNLRMGVVSGTYLAAKGQVATRDGVAESFEVDGCALKTLTVTSRSGIRVAYDTQSLTIPVIEGPQVLTVGKPATYRAVGGGTTTSWSLPRDMRAVGSQYPQNPVGQEITVVASEPVSSAITASATICDFTSVSVRAVPAPASAAPKPHRVASHRTPVAPTLLAAAILLLLLLLILLFRRRRRRRADAQDSSSDGDA